MHPTSFHPQIRTIRRKRGDEASPSGASIHCFPVMKHTPTAHPRAMAMLLAAVALPAFPAIAQNIEPLPTPVQTSPAAPPATANTATPPAGTPPATSAPIVQPRVTPPPVALTTAAPEPAAPVETRAGRPAQRAATPRRAAESRTQVIAEPAPAAITAAALPIEEAPAPVAAAPVVEPIAATPAETVPTNAPIWPWLAAGAALIAAISFLLMRRRRRAEDELAYYAEPEPVFDETVRPAESAIAPATAPVSSYASISGFTRSVAEPDTPQAAISVGEAEAEDVDAIMAEAAAPADRPWLEFTIRPVRAGMQEDDAVVEFELTVGNTGSVPAEDVRISTWMFAAGSAQESEMDRLLIEPPANASVSEVRIEPGAGARVEGAIALSKAELRGNGSTVLPVVVADARYQLPGGGEGRTLASFEVGVSRIEGEGITPFAIDDPSGMHDDIAARLHGEPQRA